MASLTDEDGIDGPFERRMSQLPKLPPTAEAMKKLAEKSDGATRELLERAVANIRKG